MSYLQACVPSCDFKIEEKLKHKSNRTVVNQASVNLVMGRAGSGGCQSLILIPTCAHTHREGEAVLINILINRSIKPHELLVVLQNGVSPLQQNCCFRVRQISAGRF